MAQSYTGVINTNGEYETVESLTNVSFTSGTTYNMQIQNQGYLNPVYMKVGNAEFKFGDEKFDFKAGSDDLYIKTTEGPIVLVILEAE